MLSSTITSRTKKSLEQHLQDTQNADKLKLRSLENAVREIEVEIDKANAEETRNKRKNERTNFLEERFNEVKCLIIDSMNSNIATTVQNLKNTISKLNLIHDDHFDQYADELEQKIYRLHQKSLWQKTVTQSLLLPDQPHIFDRATAIC